MVIWFPMLLTGKLVGLMVAEPEPSAIVEVKVAVGV